jgi:hypothetical protein
LPIHFLVPSITHSSPSRRAEVSSATESEPCIGSVSANAPSVSSAAMPGSQRCFWSSDPSMAIDCIAGPACTPTNVPRLPSPRLSSMCTSPGGGRAHRRAAVAVDAVADDPQLGEFLDQRPRELGALPVAVDHREHVLVDEVAGAFQVAQLLVGQLSAMWK